MLMPFSYLRTRLSLFYTREELTLRVCFYMICGECRSVYFVAEKYKMNSLFSKLLWGIRRCTRLRIDSDKTYKRLAQVEWVAPQGLSLQPLTVISTGYIFLVEGAISAFLAIVAYFMVPSSTQTCWFLTAEERRVASERLRESTHDMVSYF
jgi:hypothetical protein